jgi:hypothetical protein
VGRLIFFLFATTAFECLAVGARLVVQLRVGNAEAVGFLELADPTVGPDDDRDEADFP